jgi:hypothetical protein
MEEEQVVEELAESLAGVLGQQVRPLRGGRRKQRLVTAARSRLTDLLHLHGEPVHQPQGIEELGVADPEGIEHLLQGVELRQLLAGLILRELALADPGFLRELDLALAAQVPQETERPA